MQPNYRFHKFEVPWSNAFIFISQTRGHESIITCYDYDRPATFAEQFTRTFVLMQALEVIRVWDDA